MIEGSDTEEVDAVPVLAEEPVPSAALAPRVAAPIVQTAAVAAGGFVAGAAVLGLVHRRRSRRALPPVRSRRIARAGRRARQVGGIAEIVASRSLLVDVHLLGPPAPAARGR